ncbi:hypothetical protein MUU72_03680 [Streptomyces sp. RS10V-4]|uniref:hypothetical protein n=1 Tax=Streptomyces rhizoryzae TaxID=2932493 RepID=UPI002005F0FE|nr:hypothetical protein [Streptomyces rhizoryzae]MCK7622235.1 hypothetical protein [Streptomyces rhizoryzae]
MTHPRRRPAAERLAHSAPPGALRVVMDPDPAGKPSVLRTALCAWEAIEDDATHHLVVQDDMILSDSFFARARQAIARMPEAALALFALWDSRNGAAVRFGALTGARWVAAVNEYFPCVAIILPRAVAAGFVDFGRRHLDSWPDDILMGRYLHARGIPSYVSVPSLAEHEDHGSISGNAFRGPRRSVCFLPGDVPGREELRLSGLRVLPFAKNGVAQCAVRADTPGHPGHWLHLDCAQYLAGVGADPERHLPAIVRMAEDTSPEAAHATWLTAFTMGWVHRRDGLRCDPPAGSADGPPPGTDPAVLAEALATIGPGGLSHRQSEERIAEQRAALARIARAGLTAGQEAGALPRPARRRPAAPASPEAPPVQVLGAATPLGEHVVRGLADAGHRVIPLTRRPAADPAAPLLDLTPLTFSPPPPRTPGLRLTVGGREFTLLLGDLYGPGCPPDGFIGRLVWDALRSYPLTLDDPAATVRPLHTRDLVGALAGVVRTPPAAPVAGLAGAPVTAAALAEAVRGAVRPVPLTAPAPGAPPVPGPPAAGPASWPPPPPGWQAVTDLRHGLHTHAQWLAYEGIHLTLEV